jgi:GDP-L-fucose synthase
MRIAITGATGFLGTALTRALEHQGSHELTLLSRKNCDLTDAATLRACSHPRYDRIYHLAAWTQAGDFCLHHPGEQWIINQQINTNVLAWWSAEQPQAKLIAMGTSCAYDESLPLVEENYLAGEPIPSLYAYAMTKRMLYVGLKSLAQQYGLSYLHVVPSTLYGPGYHRDGRQMHFIFDLVRKILRGKWLGERVVLWGDGHQRRELVHVDEFVATLLALTDVCGNDTVNIGAGRDYSIREFAAMICTLVDYDAAAIEFDTDRHVGARAKCLRTDKLRGLRLDVPTVPLVDGLRATIAWMERDATAFLAPGPAS